MSTLSQAEIEAIAHEAWARHNPNFIPAIKEIREKLNCGLKEAKELSEIARSVLTTNVESRKLELARRVLSVHGSEYAARELVPRLDCSLSEAEALIKLVTTPPAKEPDYIWSAKGAEKWLRKRAAYLAREAKYIRENADGFAQDEDEFRCGLANGLGIDDKKEQNEIIAEIHKQTTKEV